MKKGFAVLLACLMSLILFSFSGCRENQDPGPDIGGNLEEIADTYGRWDEKPLEIVAIDKGLGVQWLKELAIVFNNATGSKIQVKADETLNIGLPQYMDAETNSDVYYTYSSEIQWVRWAIEEKIVPLDDLSLSYADPGMAKLGIYQDVRYIMPYSYNPVGFVYNQEYLDEIPSFGEYTQGEFPKTWQGLLDLCTSVNEKWNKVVNQQKVVPFSWGGSVGDMSYIFYSLWAQIDPDGFAAYYGQNNLNITGKTNHDLLVNDSTILAMDSIAKLFRPKLNAQNTYYPSNSFASSTGDSNLIAEQKFINGYCVFTISGAWFETEMQEYIEETEVDFYHFATVPLVDSQKETVTYINTPSEYFMITAKGKNQNQPLAKAFLKYLSSEYSMQVYNLLTGCPGTFSYEIPEGISGFATECAKAVQEHKKAFAASDQIPSLSGAVRLDTNSTFRELATSEFTAEISRTKLEALYQRQYDLWNGTVEDFV